MTVFSVAALGLISLAAGHIEGEQAERRLFYSSPLQHIWGSPSRCDAHLSDGPADADVEIRLGGLPASTAGQAVHLQWWSARKSPTRYDPLANPVNCSVHQNMLKAYPAYYDSDFNGGNVKVTPSGEAVIRVRAPSTYFVWQYIAVPHIHFRVCTGASDIQRASHAVMLGDSDIWVNSCGGGGIRVLSAGRYAGRVASSAPTRGYYPVAVITGVERRGGRSTTLPETTTTLPLTTTAPPAGSTTPLGVLISAARDALDLDALEFSPVYGCLMEQKLYDHFSSGCASECPANSAVAHGQCVRRETPEPKAQLEKSWRLSVECGTPCWHNKRNASLHNLRLSFAGHLDIPFQEVEISVGFDVSTARRLSGGARTAYLTVRVASNRLSAAEGEALLDSSYGQDAASLSSVLGLDVRAVTPGSAPAQQDDSAKMGPTTDPYDPFYTAIEIVVLPPSSIFGFLPAEAVFGIGAGVVLFTLAFAAMLWRRRRQQRQAAQAQKAKALEEMVAEAVPEPKKLACV